MIRAPMADQAYWDEWIDFVAKNVLEKQQLLSLPSPNPAYDPEYSFGLAKGHLELILLHYSRGDPIGPLAQHFSGLLDAWELSNRLAEAVCREHGVEKCRGWTFALSSLNYYNWCFWLVGLALALEIPDGQWQRLLALVGGEGEDMLLDRVIASRQAGRRIGRALLHPRPYARLLRAIDAAPGRQAALLREFVVHWYPELARKRREDELWWHIRCDLVKVPLARGSYFGCWCIEAVAAVKAFGLDDSLCLGHAHYPGDLLRPHGSGTHRAPSGEDGPGAAALGHGSEPAAQPGAGRERVGALRYVLAALAFFLTWGMFPSQALAELGVGYAWIGLAKIVAAITAACLVADYRRKKPQARSPAQRRG